jgi:hypothetical protein
LLHDVLITLNILFIIACLVVLCMIEDEKPVDHTKEFKYNEHQG